MFFKPNYNSHYKKYANQSLDWLTMDTQILYEKHLKLNYSMLLKNNWIDYKSFTYKFNSHGFRCNEFNDSPTIMFIGCSNTCGVGLPIETIWPELVSKNLNMQCANLGQAGGSNDTAFRLCHGWIDKIQPKIVVLLNPPGVRLEIVTNKHNIRHLNPQWGNDLEDYPFLKEWCMDNNNNYFNILKNTLAIENVCKSKNIKFVCFTLKEWWSIRKPDLARDLTHAGIVSNHNFAEYALTKI